MDFTLNNYFDKVYVINMDKDVDRIKHFENEMSKVNTNFIRTPGIIADKQLIREEASFFGKYFAPNSVIGVSYAHKKLWKSIVDNNLNNALIFEDDVKLTDNVSVILPQAINELPPDWDILFLGCLTCCDKLSIYEIFYKIFNTKRKQYSNHLNTGGVYLGAEAYVVSYNGAKKLLNLINKISYSSDFQINILQMQNKIKVFDIIPAVAYQNRLSNISKTVSFSNVPVILNKITENIDINKDCFNDTRTLDWMLSFPLLKLFSKLLTFNLYCIIFFIISFAIPYVAHILIAYLIIDIIYNRFNNLSNYIPLLLSVIIGYLLHKYLIKI
jgi:glycosyl transferase family 25